MFLRRNAIPAARTLCVYQYALQYLNRVRTGNVVYAWRLREDHMKVLLTFTEIHQKFGALRSQHGLASISAVLKARGISVALAYFAETIDLDRFRNQMETFKPEVVGFYSTAEQFHFVSKLISAVPEGIFTILGGPHATCYPKCIEAVPRLDALCVGEGEYPMVDLTQALQAGTDHTKIANLWVRHGGQITCNPTRPFVANLDELPYEDRELFNTQEAIDEYGMAQIRVMGSRGCPFHCTYCSNRKVSTTQPGQYVRFRSAAHVLGELNALKEKYRFEEVFFVDDIFMMNRRGVDEFCERYPKEIGKPFVFCGRVELCNEAVLRKLKNAGGRRIDFGVESGNEEIRREVMKRRMTNEEILEATRMAKSVGLQVKTYNMVGMPEETPEKHRDTIRLNQQIKPDVASIAVFYPYPGTSIYDMCLAKGYLHPDESLPENYVSRRQSVLTLPGFSKGQISWCFRWFGFRVFWRDSLVKAIGMRAIYSNRGEPLLKMTHAVRKAFRKILKGF